MTVDSHVIRELEAIVGADHVRTEAGDVEPYSRDATPTFRAVPDAVVWPRTAEEVAAILKLATARHVPVVPRGAGSNLCAGTLADRGGIVLVLTRMDEILEVSSDELLARVETGVTTTALSDAAAAKGLLYAPDPGSRTVSTVGGNVATCAGGLRGLKYGLTRLLTGSEGTLGVLTEVTVALLPMPASTNTGVAYFPTLSDAGTAVGAIIGAGIVPATLEFLDAKCIGAVEEYAHLGLRSDAGALLLFGDDGAEDVVERNLTRIGEICTDTKAMEVTLAENIARAQALLEARRCSLPALSRLGTMTILEDATVPRPRLAEMVGRIDAIAASHEVPVATFGHAGDGNLHPTIVVDQHDDDGIKRAHEAFGDIFKAAIGMEGTITGEHGVGAAKLPYLTDRLGADQMALLRRIKAAFDPAGILNPGKLGS